MSQGTGDVKGEQESPLRSSLQLAKGLKFGLRTLSPSEAEYSHKDSMMKLKADIYHVT